MTLAELRDHLVATPPADLTPIVRNYMLCEEACLLDIQWDEPATTYPMGVEVHLSREVVEGSEDIGAQSVMQLLGSALARSFADLLINGDTESANPFLSQCDGVVKLAEHTHDLADGLALPIRLNPANDCWTSMDPCPPAYYYVPLMPFRDGRCTALSLDPIRINVGMAVTELDADVEGDLIRVKLHANVGIEIDGAGMTFVTLLARAPQWI
jgi:hypothetical protein